MLDTARPATLRRAFDPRRNSLAVLRLVLAGVVAVAHGLDLARGWQPSVGRTDLADVAVDAFFVLSGFLVAGSHDRLGSAGRFAWHRFLRIVPGFWTCLVVTALVVAPLAAVLAGRQATSVFTTGTDPAWRYPLVNAALPMLQYGIAGISVRGPSVFDGSLWTLQYEAFCYAVLAGLGALGLLAARRRSWLVLLCALVWIAAGLQDAGLLPVDVPVFDNDRVLRFLLVFLLGVLGHRYADRVPVRADLALVSGGVLAGSFFLADYRLVGAAALGYLCLYAVVRLPLRWTPPWDLSYGLYIYHWPVQVLLLLAGAAVVGPVLFTVLALAVTLLVAAGSWLLVEAPALRRKGARWPARRERRTV